MLQILSESKNFLTEDTATRIRFPKYPETSTAKLWPMVVQDPLLKAYFPDTWTTPKKVEMCANATRRSMVR